MGLFRSCWQWTASFAIFDVKVYCLLFNFLFASDALHSVFILFILLLYVYIYPLTTFNSEQIKTTAWCICIFIMCTGVQTQHIKSRNINGTMYNANCNILL